MFYSEHASGACQGWAGAESHAGALGEEAAQLWETDRAGTAGLLVSHSSKCPAPGGRNAHLAPGTSPA